MELDADIVTRIKGYVSAIDSTINTADGSLDFAINEVADRVMLYLNREDLPPRVERIVARVVIAVSKKTAAEQAAGGQEQAITSVSDNGQRIAYSENAKRYLATAEDQELFTGFTKLLAPYRRIKVV